MVIDDENVASQRRNKLIESLESNLLDTEGANQRLSTYFTLGAITGSYYQDYDQKAA